MLIAAIDIAMLPRFSFYGDFRYHVARLAAIVRVACRRYAIDITSPRHDYYAAISALLLCCRLCDAIITLMLMIFAAFTPYASRRH